MDLSSLKNLFDINIDLDLRGASLINVEGGDKLQVENDTLQVNVPELDQEEREGVIDLTQDHFEEDGRILGADEEDETQAIEQGYSGRDDILSYFEGILEERYISILKMSLNLRAVLEQRDLQKDEIQRRKMDIADVFGPEAMYITSLCTAGYFDQDGGLRDIYVDMELKEGYTRHDFNDHFSKLIEDKLLCVFVENDGETDEVTTEVRGALAKYQDMNPVNDWLDIRGIGSDCVEIIDGVMENLEEEFYGMNYSRLHEDDQLIIRIDADTVSII